MSTLIHDYRFLPWFDAPLQSMMARFEQGNFPQSLLMLGEQGIGKKYFAQDLAKSILCLDKISGKACGVCQSCIWFDKNSHPDFLFIHSLEKSNFIKIDQIRQLTQFVHMTSETGQKVVVIENADEMNTHAANALLKTLEEPMSQCYLILVTNYPKKLPITITSRCQRQTLSIYGQQAVIMAWLKEQNIELSEDNIKKIMVLSYGRPLLAAEFLTVEQLKLINALEELFARFLLSKDNLEELSLFMVKNWQLSSHLLLFWLSQALKNDAEYSIILAQLSKLDRVDLLNVYDNFVKIIQLESTTIKQDWMVNGWLLKFR